MFEIISKEQTDLGPLYIFQNERGFNLRLTHLPSDRIMMTLTNKGVPIAGGMGLTYFCNQISFNIDRPITCNIKDVDELIADINSMKEMAVEIEGIISRIRGGEI